MCYMFCQGFTLQDYVLHNGLAFSGCTSDLLDELALGRL